MERNRLRQVARQLGSKLGLNLAVFLAVVTVVPSIALIEFALRRPDSMVPRRTVDPALASRAEIVRLNAADNVALVASFFKTPIANDGRCLLLQHGVASQRLEMPGFIHDFPQAGFSVLSVDSRGHGESGGDRVTYGALERDDMRRWFAYLEKRAECRNGLFGLGLSMGAAILLQTLPDVPAVQAAAAESPFASFREIGHDRIGQVLPLLSWIRKPMVQVGFTYANAIRGIDFDAVSPLEAAPKIKAPVLLIHGTEDQNISIRHSELLLPKLKQARLHKVQGAQHVGCYGRDSARYIQEVVAWFNAAR